YDFLANTGRQNLPAHPLGPGEGPRDFRHDGGEIIFNLPNGLQGYLLVDGRGNRIDRAPLEIVQDARQKGAAVVNGISCMGCHVRGVRDKDDEVRASVLKNTAFPREEADTILALYPPKEEMDRLLREDAARFAAAVEKTGGRLTATDPI